MIIIIAMSVYVGLLFIWVIAIKIKGMPVLDKTEEEYLSDKTFA